MRICTLAESHQKGKQSNLFTGQKRSECGIAIIPEEVRIELGLTDHGLGSLQAFNQ